MKEIDKIKHAFKNSDLVSLKASKYMSQLYKDDTILLKKENELLEKYSHVPRSAKENTSKFSYRDLFLALLIGFAFFNYIIFYS